MCACVRRLVLHVNLCTMFYMYVYIYIYTYGLCTVYTFVNFVIPCFLFANSFTWNKKIGMII